MCVVSKGWAIDERDRARPRHGACWDWTLPTTDAQQAEVGTATEAKAMLVRAIAAVKADKAKALDLFAKGEGGFLGRDLYPFCFNISDGKINLFAMDGDSSAWTFARSGAARTNTPRRRSRKVNSPRSAIRFQNRARVRRGFRRSPSSPGTAIQAAASAITSRRFWHQRFCGAPRPSYAVSLRISQETR